MYERVEHPSWQWFQEPDVSAGVRVTVIAGLTRERQERWTLRGPFCSRARTLPASFPLEPMTSSESSDHWQATIIDPCYWTPSLPSLYRLQREDEQGRSQGQVGHLGLRCLQARAGNLWLDGRRWVFRGVRANGSVSHDVAQCHEQLLGIVLDNWSDELTAEASLAGTPLIVRLSAENWRAELFRCQSCSAVQLAVLPASWPGDRQQLREIAPNLLFVADLTANNDVAVPGWADSVLVPAVPPALERLGQLRPRPAILVESWELPAARVSTAAGIAGWRRSCELLQRALAPGYDVSGYIIRPMH